MVLSIEPLAMNGKIISFMLREENNEVAVLFNKSEWRVVRCSVCLGRCIHSEPIESYLNLLDDNFDWYGLVMWVYDYYSLRRVRVLWWKLTDGLIAPDHPLALKIRRAENEERRELQDELHKRMIESINKNFESMDIETLAYITMIGLPERLDKAEIPRWDEGFNWGSESGIFVESFLYGIGG